MKIQGHLVRFESKSFTLPASGTGQRQNADMKEHLQDFSYPKILETPQVFKAKLLLNPFPNDRFLDTSTMKEFANDNFKFDENSRGFYKLVENTEGKGEISPLLTVISKDLFCRHPGLVWERLNPLLHRYSF